MMFLAMHIINININNNYYSYFTVGSLLNIYMEHDLYLISARRMADKNHFGENQQQFRI